METINILNIAAVPVITVICFLAAECAKLTPMKDNWLPALCGLIGGALGAAAMYISPELVPATDIFTAIAIGIVSGLAATGVHQIGKQLSKMDIVPTMTDPIQDEKDRLSIETLKKTTGVPADTVKVWIRDQDEKQVKAMQQDKATQWDGKL
jgi:hypothetical protein